MSSVGAPPVTRPPRPVPPSRAHIPHASPKSRRPVSGPPRRVGRPLVAFSNSTANRSRPQPRHNPSPGGKVCPRQGERRHLAASSPRRPFLRPARPLDSRSCGGVSRARKGLQLESAPHGARRRTGTALTRKGLPDRAGALERFPSPSRHHPHSLFRHHCRPPATGHPSPRSQKPAHVTSARGAAPSAASAVSRGRGAGSPPAGLAACGYPIYPNESALFLSTQLFLFL